MNILMLMAGPDDLFADTHYSYPKNLVEVNGIPLVERVIDSVSELLGSSNDSLICVIRREENLSYYTESVIKLLIPESRIVEVNSTTSGAVCSALLSIEYIDNQDPLLIMNGDQIIEESLSPIVKDFQSRNLDGGVIVFEAVHPRWSYVRCNDDNFIVEAAEKRPISKLATAGFYYFAQGHDFVISAMSLIRKDAHVNGSFYVCPTYNEMLLLQKKLGIYKISKESYFSLASPQGVSLYEEHLRSKLT